MNKIIAVAKYTKYGVSNIVIYKDKFGIFRGTIGGNYIDTEEFVGQGDYVPLPICVAVIKAQGLIWDEELWKELMAEMKTPL